MSLNVILHIGTEKTGTSSIQHFLHLNRRRLPQYGFHLLQSGGDYDQRALAAYTRPDKERDSYFVEQGIESAEDRAKFRADLERAIDKELTSLPSGIHSVIISSEHFHSTIKTDQAMDRLKTLLSKYFQKVKVICYLREQGAMCTSWYSTALKFGLCRTQKTFVQRQCHPKNYYFNYWQLLNRWEGAFGKDALDVSIYDKSEFRSGDLLEDFTGRVDPVLLGQLESYKLQANQSLSPEGQRLLLGVNCAFPQTTAGVEAIRVICREEIYKLLKGRGQQLDLPTRKSIYQSFLECNSSVQKRYFPDRKELFPEPDQESPKEEEFSDDGKRALEQVLNAVGLHAGRRLTAEDVSDAQHLIKEIYLGNAGIPFDWNGIHLFGKGLLKARADGTLHTSLVIRNTSSEALEFSKTGMGLYSIGWQMLDLAGGQIDGLRGTVNIEKTVPGGSFKNLSVAFCPDFDYMKIENAVTIEFCLVDGVYWMNEKYPLNSVWLALAPPG